MALPSSGVDRRYAGARGAVINAGAAAFIARPPLYGAPAFIAPRPRQRGGAGLHLLHGLPQGLVDVLGIDAELLGGGLFGPGDGAFDGAFDPALADGDQAGRAALDR